MTFAFAQSSTRRVPPSHQQWNAHPYQRRGVAHLKASHVAALWLDPGLGKTSITLQAFCDLKAAGRVRTMLVIAPLRVCQAVWRQEATKWTQFRDLKFSLLHGAKKEDRLKDDADIWLINPEGVPWLAKKFAMRNVPFDIVTVDEITKFKNHQSERSKALRPRLAGVRYKWGLTGTPAPNGYMDLFGQFLLLDQGAALGRYVTHYRDLYFQVDFDGFTYNLMPGAQKRIEEKLRPYVLCMSADDYLALPEVRDNAVMIDLPPKSRATYEAMKKQMLAELPEGTVTAANAAAVYSKLAQMANGAVYVNENKDYAEIHGEKIEALDELIEDLNGQQLFIAYEFNHDIERLKKHFGDRLVHLAPGMSAEAVDQIVRDWNAGRITNLAAHPASAGHGLNMQGSNCQHVAWFSPPWDLELYMQFIQRIRRQGNTAQRITNHLLLVRDSIDELKLAALGDKNTSQGRLMGSLKVILHDAETHAAGQPATQESSMVGKLSRQDSAAAPAAGPGFFGRKAANPTPQVDETATIRQPQAQAQTTEAPRAQPKGWGAPAGAVQADGNPGSVQRTEALLRTGEVIDPPNHADAKSYFSPGVRQAMTEIAGEGVSHPNTGAGVVTTGPWPTPAAEQGGVPFDQAQPIKEVDTAPAKRSRAKKGDAKEAAAETTAFIAPEVKLGILQLAFANPETTLEDGMEIAEKFLAFVTE